jgi:4-coumarate--CoA ligase
MTKIILEDNWTGKFMTYGGLRTTAAQGAWGLRKNLRLRQGDVTAIICPNAVCLL